MWWKIYFILNAAVVGLSLLVYAPVWQKLSFGDVITIILSLLTVVALYSFSYRKKLVEKPYWRALLGILIFDSLITYFATYITFSGLSAFFVPTYILSVIKVAEGNVVFQTISNIFSFLLSVPTWYVLSMLAFKDLKPHKATEQKNIVEKNARTSKLATSSLVTGILGFILGPGLTIAAFITGIIAVTKIDRSKGKLKGKKRAWAGIIMSTIQIVFIGFAVSIAILLFSTPGLVGGEKEAIKHMNNDQYAFYNTKLKKITSDTSKDQLNALFGAPPRIMKNGPEIIYSYKCSEKLASVCRVNVYTQDGEIKKVGWINFGKFWYWHDFTQDVNDEEE
jgi:hypothetical protein